MSTAHAHPVERWLARSGRVLWWVGLGLVVLVAIVELDSLTEDLDALAMTAVSAGLIASYVVAVRRPSAGLLAACAISVALGLLGNGLDDLIATCWLVLVLLSGVAAHRSATAHLLGLLVALVTAISVSAIGRLDDLALDGVVFVSFALSVSIGIGLLRRLSARRNQLNVERARDAERAELARELHDVVAHHVTAIVVQAQAGQFSGDPEVAARSLAAIETEGSAALAAMRRLVTSLRSGDAPQGSTDLIGEVDVLADVLRASGVTVDISIDDVPDALVPTLVRLTREAFTNVRRHARAPTCVAVTVRSTRDLVEWGVVDDGAEPNHVSAAGFGLIGMRERVEAWGGAFEAGRSGGGFRVAASLPLDGTSS